MAMRYLKSDNDTLNEQTGLTYLCTSRWTRLSCQFSSGYAPPVEINMSSLIGALSTSAANGMFMHSLASCCTGHLHLLLAASELYTVFARSQMLLGGILRMISSLCYLAVLQRAQMRMHRPVGSLVPWFFL